MRGRVAYRLPCAHESMLAAWCSGQTMDLQALPLSASQHALHDMVSHEHDSRMAQSGLSHESSRTIKTPYVQVSALISASVFALNSMTYLHALCSICS